jgi:hypothetical protein
MTTPVDAMAAERAFDDVDGLPAQVRLDGLPEYPRYAAEDFDRAFLRFCILTGDEEAFGDAQEAQLVRDMSDFPELTGFSGSGADLVMPEERALDFVAKVTGHSHAWVASWNYRVALNDVAAEARGDTGWFLKTSAKAYDDAVRYARRDMARTDGRGDR